MLIGPFFFFLALFAGLVRLRDPDKVFFDETYYVPASRDLLLNNRGSILTTVNGNGSNIRLPPWEEPLII